jgi:hypothetical protein
MAGDDTKVLFLKSISQVNDKIGKIGERMAGVETKVGQLNKNFVREFKYNRSTIKEIAEKQAACPARNAHDYINTRLDRVETEMDAKQSKVPMPPGSYQKKNGSISFNKIIKMASIFMAGAAVVGTLIGSAVYACGGRAEFPKVIHVQSDSKE